MKTSRTARWVTRIFFLFVLLFLYVPILVLAVFSFTDATTLGRFGQGTFANYVNLVAIAELRQMILGTLLLALIVATLATLLGTTGALGAFYSRMRIRRSITTMNQIPVVNADVVTGFSLTILLVIVLGISKDTYVPLLVGHLTLCTPFVFLAVMPRIRQLDPSQYEAALDLGATPFRALKQIVIPQIAPGIFSGFALALTLSLDDYFVTTYTKPATFDTISTYVVNATRGSQTTIKTALWALSTVIFVVIFLGVLLLNIRSFNRSKKGVAHEPTV